MSSVTVNGFVDDGAIVAGDGVIETSDRVSAAPTTRTCASIETEFSEAVRVTDADWAIPFTSTVAVFCPVSTVTPPPTTVRLPGSEDVIATNTSDVALDASVTVSASGP